MKHIKDIYPMVQQVRQRIFETMQERHIAVVQFCPANEEEYNQEHENDEEYQDWTDYRYDNCPNVVYFDKYGCGYEYQVLSVSLVGTDHPRLRLYCYSGELGSDEFMDSDVYEMTWVYEMLEKHLELDEEPEKVMVLYEVCEDDNTKTSIVAMTEENWKKRKAETIEKVLRDYYDERYNGCDDDYFCYEDEIKQATEALTTGYDTEFNGDSVFWDEVTMIS